MNIIPYLRVCKEVNLRKIDSPGKTIVSNPLSRILIEILVNTVVINNFNVIILWFSLLKPGSTLRGAYVLAFSISERVAIDIYCGIDKDLKH